MQSQLFCHGQEKLLANHYTNQQIQLYICYLTKFLDKALKHLNLIFQNGKGKHVFPIVVIFIFLWFQVWQVIQDSIYYKVPYTCKANNMYLPLHHMSCLSPYGYCNHGILGLMTSLTI